MILVLQSYHIIDSCLCRIFCDAETFLLLPPDRYVILSIFILICDKIRLNAIVPRLFQFISFDYFILINSKLVLLQPYALFVQLKKCFIVISIC